MRKASGSQEDRSHWLIEGCDGLGWRSVCGRDAESQDATGGLPRRHVCRTTGKSSRISVKQLAKHAIVRVRTLPCLLILAVGLTSTLAWADQRTFLQRTLDWSKRLTAKNEHSRSKAVGHSWQGPLSSGHTLWRAKTASAGSVASQLAVARQLYHAGQLREAKRRVQQLVVKRPSDAEARLLLAEIALDSGDMATYTECLRVLIALSESPDLLSAAGSRLFQCASSQDRAEELRREAITALRRAADQQPSNEQFARNLAAGLVQQDRYEEAIAVLKKIQTRAPNDIDSLAVLALLSERANRWQEAAGFYGLLCQLEPKQFRWHRGRGRCAYRAGDVQTARDELAVCFRAAPADCTPAELTALADASMRLGEYELAERALQTLAALQPRPVREVELLRALCWLHRGDIVRARGILNIAMTYWPQDPVLRRALTLCSRQPAESEGVRPVPAQPRAADIELTVAKELAGEESGGTEHQK